MRSTAADCSPAIVPDDAAILLNVTPGLLTAAFATVSDPRRCQGRRYPLAVILALAVVALLSNCTSVLAIAQFEAEAPLALRQALGFVDGQVPRPSTVHRLFAKLNPDALIAVLAQACGQVIPQVCRQEAITSSWSRPIKAPSSTTTVSPARRVHKRTVLGAGSVVERRA